MDIGSWITRDNFNLAVAAAALVTAGGAWRAGHRSAKATEDSATAARESAAEAKRSADVAEQSLAVARETLEMQQAAARPQVKLNIERIGRGTWLLINDGAAVAENPTLDPDDANHVNWEEPLGLQLQGGESRRMHARHPASMPAFLRFTWDGQSEPVFVRWPSLG